MTAADPQLDDFIAFSSDVTAFSNFDLRGTGLAEVYLATVRDIVGGTTLSELLVEYGAARADSRSDEAELERSLRKFVFSHDKLGPIARNIIKLWYVGIWYELPREWTEAFGALEHNVTFGISAVAYAEGLLWSAIGANPPGAKAPGYGSWARAPRIDEKYTKGVVP
jgi:hypothetical protein